MQRIEVLLRGTRPLLFNRMSMDALEGLRDKTKKKPKTAGAEPPEDEAARKLYTTSEGRPYLPVEMLMACLIEAGKFIRLDGKRQLSTSASTVLPGLLTIEDEIMPMLKPEDEKDSLEWGIAQWRYDMRQGRNPNGGEAVCIVRPMFSRWAARLTALIDTSTLPESTYRQLFDMAGLRVGLGDFRPARKGIFGQFRVDLWKAAEALAI